MNSNSNKKTFERRRYKLSLKLSIISTVISICSLLFNVFVWYNNTSPSISIQGNLGYDSYTYEEFIYKEKVYGRFIMKGQIVVTNHSSQGCVLYSNFYLPLENDEYGIFYEREGFENGYFVDGDPFNGMVLKERESKITDCKIYIYFEESVHNEILNNFGNDYSKVSVYDIVRFLHEKSINVDYEAPSLVYPTKKTYKPLKEGYLTLSIMTNTGASDYIFIDYGYREWLKETSKRKNIIWDFFC